MTLVGMPASRAASSGFPISAVVGSQSGQRRQLDLEPRTTMFVQLNRCFDQSGLLYHHHPDESVALALAGHIMTAPVKFILKEPQIPDSRRIGPDQAAKIESTAAKSPSVSLRLFLRFSYRKIRKSTGVSERPLFDFCWIFRGECCSAMEG